MQLVPVLFTFCIQGMLKLKKKIIPAPKGQSIPEAVITAVPAPDDGCQHPKHVELPTEM